jgi:hypothetical protein
MRIVNLAMAALAAAALAFPAAPVAAASNDTYSRNEIVVAVSDFFGVTTEAAAKAVEHVFSKHGRPNGYIIGSEGSGAVVVGVRYGDGQLYYKRSRRPHKVYWQGPSVGFDVGANASKCFTLVYNLPSVDKLYQRYPGVEGSYYFIAGIGINYQQSGRTILAPMRTGVGIRAGVNAGYLSYSRERSWVPF